MTGESDVRSDCPSITFNSTLNTRTIDNSQKIRDPVASKGRQAKKKKTMTGGKKNKRKVRESIAFLLRSVRQGGKGGVLLNA